MWKEFKNEQPKGDFINCVVLCNKTPYAATWMQDEGQAEGAFYLDIKFKHVWEDLTPHVNHWMLLPDIPESAGE